MTRADALILNKIHEDLESLKRDITEIKVAINLEPELKEEIKQQVNAARKRISKGEFISNEEVMSEFEMKIGLSGGAPL